MFKPADGLILLAVILVTWLWSSGAPDASGGPEGVRIVSLSGEDTLDILMDTLVYRGEVTIEIRSGRAAITESDCPTRQCVRTGWIEVPGEMSACMPNGVFIEVVGSAAAPDAMSY
jgi:hypothetical protein